MDPVVEDRLLWCAGVGITVVTAAAPIAWRVSRGLARVFVVVGCLIILLTLLVTLMLLSSLGRGVRLGPVVVTSIGGILFLGGAGWWWMQPQERRTRSNAAAGRTCLDYNVSGEFEINNGSTVIRLKFTEGDRSSVRIYQGQGGVAALAKLGGLQTGQQVNFSAFPTVKSQDQFFLGENFAIRTTDMHFLVGKIQSVTNSRFGDATNEVCFSYAWQPTSSGDLQAL